MIKTTSALLIVALGQFNYLYKHKEIVPQKHGQASIGKTHHIADAKGGRKQVKSLFSKQEKSLEKTPKTQYFTAHNSFSAILETSQVRQIKPFALSLTKAARDAARGCCMMMAA
jgi:hypothetical protein